MFTLLDFRPQIQNFVIPTSTIPIYQNRSISFCSTFKGGGKGVLSVATMHSFTLCWCLWCFLVRWSKSGNINETITELWRASEHTLGTVTHEQKYAKHSWIQEPHKQLNAYNSRMCLKTTSAGQTLWSNTHLQVHSCIMAHISMNMVLSVTLPHPFEQAGRVSTRIF